MTLAQFIQMVIDKLRGLQTNPPPPDTTPPTVHLTASQTSFTQPGPVTLDAQVNDNSGVIRQLQFYFGTTPLGDPLTAPPFTLTFTVAGQAQAGTYRAVALDLSGNSGEDSLDLTVSTAADTTPPTVSLSAAPNPVTAAGNVILTATPGDDRGVTLVQLREGVTVLGSRDKAPWTFLVPVPVGAAQNGTRTFHAVAFDAAGNSGQSPDVPVTIALPAILPLDGLQGGYNFLQGLSDASPNARHLTLSGTGTDPLQTPAGLLFDGTNDQLTLPPTLFTGPVQTFVLRLRPDGNRTAANWRFLSLTFGNGIFELYREVNQQVLAMTWAADGNTRYVNLQRAWALNALKTVGVRLDRAAGKVWVSVDGEPWSLYTGQTLAPFATLTAAALGCNAARTTSWNGPIRQLAVYNRALSDAEIAEIAQAYSDADPAPDVTAPTVSLTATPTRRTSAGPVTLSAIASDNVYVYGVQFSRDGTPLGKLQTAPYTMTDDVTAGTPNGTIVYTARALDAAGNWAEATAEVVVDIPAVTPFTPYVSFPASRAAARNRNPATIPWEPARTIDQASVNAGDWGPVVTLSDGSSGVRIEDRHFRTDIPGENALKMKADLQVAVELRRSGTFSYGTGGYLKSGNLGLQPGVDVRAYDHLFFSGKPPAGYDGASPARFLKADKAKNLIVDGFEGYGAGGFYFDGWGGDSGQVCHIRNGGAYNVDGRKVDANGNWRTSSVLSEYFETVQFAQLNNAVGVRNFIWELFEVINDPLYGAMFEDALSAHAGSGTLANNILWRDYLIENCLPFDGGVFAAAAGKAARYGRGPDGNVRPHSGTGGLAGDGGSPSGVTRTADTMAGRIRASRFTILTSYNAFTGISSGNRSTLEEFVAYGVRAFRSAAPAGYTLLEKSFTGVQLIDYQTGYDPAFWFGHVIGGGQIGVFAPNPDGTLSTSTASGATPTSLRNQVKNGSSLMVSNGPNSAIAGLDTIMALPNPGTILAGLDVVDQLRAARRADIISRGGVLGVRA